ncbi:protein MLN51 homolog isoform X2 [Rutidosis leptorrhynchoides]|uniref:protein MLN51 homolog isoform X2 n=1 Tax=Rutidosis leptorrhynchoides TaxID=125765 RepID=UPI003A98DD53
MAVTEEDEYESDPEQTKLSLQMRRRVEASDDENEDSDSRNIGSRVSDYESDEQGAPAEYDDDDDDDDVNDDDVNDDVESELDEEVVIVEEDKEYVVEQVVENMNGSEAGEGEKGKKENEPFAVPTAGAFYMHDDRFRGISGRGRGRGGGNRRNLGGNKLWETRDDKKWGHDKFEELTTQERPYFENRRGSRGRNRGRGRYQGQNREYSHGNRPKPQDNNYQNSEPKFVRGKGPRRYRPVTKNNAEASSNNRRPLKSLEKGSHTSTGKASYAATSTSESAQIPSGKNSFASRLNYASPPFYPSGSSNQEANLGQKRNTQTGHFSQSSNMQRKSVPDSLGMEKLYINDTVSSHSGKHLNKGRSQAGQTLLGQRTYQPVPPHNQGNRHPLPKVSSPPKVPGPTQFVESKDVSSSLESNNSKMALVGKGKGGVQGNAMGSFPYGGNHGDQNFTGAPRFLPGQHPGGMGVPAVGMAFPGYVGQPNGIGNSEMTWLPVLAGAARGLGASGGLGGAYGSPYMTMDGAYHAQTSFMPPASSKENLIEPGNNVKPFQRSELVNDESSGQRLNKARRQVRIWIHHLHFTIIKFFISIYMLIYCDCL